MSWHPSDLLADADLIAYEPRLFATFGVIEYGDQRSKAIEDWLWPSLRAAGFDPQRFRTRFAAEAVRGYTSSAYTDLTSAASSTTADDVALATVLAASSDYLYIGSTQPFRGVSLRLLDAVSSVATTLTVETWADRWIREAVADGTQGTPGKPLSAGGALTWRVRSEWAMRHIDSVGPYYWARLSCAAAPTGATASQIGVIRRSLLCAPVAFRTLAQIFRAAPLSQDGPWEDKARYYEDAADAALSRALPILGGEFDTVTADDVIDAEEAAQTPDEARGASGWTLERA